MSDDSRKYTAPPGVDIDAMREALRMIDELEAELAEHEQRSREPIAVVGIGCRLPGSVRDPDGLWRALCDELDGIVPVPPQRWDRDALYDPNPDTAGKMYVREGGFLDRVDQFDAELFGISPREAADMDPQQRMALEVAWETFEHAGVAPDSLTGTATGVYLGVMATDYVWLHAQRPPAQRSVHTGTGTEPSFVAGRLSHYFGLQGPSMVVASACSSSLVAVHLACQALRAGECSRALAGGVNLMLSPDISLLLSRMRALSPDGRCKSFDAAADGYGRGEGCGLVLLERLDDALAAGRRVLAVVRGTAVGHDGRSAGVTVPNGPAQARVIRAALDAAALEPAAIDYVEAHGTGTPLGDPIEVGVLGEVLAADRREPLLLGSIKTNFGHLEAAAGIAGFIKTVLALEHGELPAHLHLRTPTPHVDWDALAVRIVGRRTPWPRGDRPRHAGVSSFGMSGVNAHVILGEAPQPEPAPARPRSHQLIVLSAIDRERLAELALIQAEALRELDGAALSDAAFTLQRGRAQLRERLGVVVEHGREAAAALESLARGHGELDAFDGWVRSAKASPPKLAFLYTGQGQDELGVARALHESEPVFRAAFDACAAQLDPKLRAAGRGSLLDALSATPAPDLIQPASFAVAHALTALWASWGVVPDAVLGHSFGELAAACAAGVMTPGDGLRFAAARGRLMTALPDDGAMLAIRAGAGEVVERIAVHADAVCVAAINGPRSTVISGDRAAIEALERELADAGLQTRRLAAARAFHSPRMDPILATLEHSAAAMQLSPPTRRLISTVLGRDAGAEPSSPAYWARHAREPVRYQAGLEQLVAAGVQVFIEIGVRPDLCSMGATAIADPELAWLPSLRPDRSAHAQLLAAVGRAHAAGIPIDWEALHAGRGARPRVLPRTPFRARRYWMTEAGHASPSPSAASSTVLAQIERGDVEGLLDTLGPSLAADERAVANKLLAGLVARHRSEQLERRVDDWIYAVAWPVRAHEAVFDPPRFIPPPSGLAPALASAVPELLAAADIVTYEAGLAELERYTGERLARTLFDMAAAAGERFAVGERVSSERLLTALEIAAPQRRLLARILDILAEDGVLERDAEGWLVRRLPSDPVAPSEPASRGEQALTERCLARIDEVLTGRVDPLTLLFPAGDQREVAALYRDTPTARVIHTLVERTVAASIDRLPPGRRLRILEVGAGTGATTSHVVPGLPKHRVHYRFTDQSAAFTVRAAERFAAYPWFETQVLDLERDPLDQGLAEASHDLILATNVIHATRDLHESLVHLRRLLAPGGLLVAVEGVAPTRWIDVTFGLTAGWHRFVDVERRPRHPLASAEAWTEVLAAAGFDDATIVPLEHEHGLGVLRRQAVILARAADTNAASVAEPRRYMLLPDRGGVAESLAAELRARNATVALATSESVRSAAGLDGVVDLRHLDLRLGDRAEASFEAVADACGELVELVHELDAPDVGAPTLFIVTRGAVAVDGDLEHAVQAPLWALGRSIAVERPELGAVRVDLDPRASATSDDARAVLAELLEHRASSQAAREDEVAFRGGVRHVSRLRRLPLEPAAAITLRPDRSYLLTGGLGGLGLTTAEWMIERGAQRLVLVGRSEPSPAARARIRSFEDRGATVRIEAVDVTRRAELEDLLARIDVELGPLAGVVHGAGVLDNGVLGDLQRERVATVLAPKLLGALLLDEATRERELDFFVLYSAFAGLLANVAQASHGAANAFLDALAHARRQAGLPALSVAWGGWSEIGAAASAEARALLGKKGLGMIEPAAGLAALARVWTADQAQVAVVPVDWLRFAEQQPDLALVSDLVAAARAKPEPEHEPTRAEVDEGAGLLAELHPLAPAERSARVAARIERELARVLDLDAGTIIDPEAGLFELGMDSLTSLELRNRIQRMVGDNLPATVTIDYPSVRALTGLILDVLGLGADADEPEPGELDAVDVDALSEDEAEAMLLEQLERMGV